MLVDPRTFNGSRKPDPATVTRPLHHALPRFTYVPPQCIGPAFNSRVVCGGTRSVDVQTCARDPGVPGKDRACRRRTTKEGGMMSDIRTGAIPAARIRLRSAAVSRSQETPLSRIAPARDVYEGQRGRHRRSSAASTIEGSQAEVDGDPSSNLAHLLSSLELERINTSN
ncbi:MAG: hypothetical protein M1815_006172 [Lichina confinis]|nr:MAG: hypothetical protein M1815_006172 [Lichina confinis]